MLDKTQYSPAEVASMMQELGRNASDASKILATASGESKSATLLAAADSLRANVQSILKANEIDMANGKDQGLSNAMMDRLKLTEERVADMANAVVSIAEMDDPVGQVMAPVGAAQRAGYLPAFARLWA